MMAPRTLVACTMIVGAVFVAACAHSVEDEIVQGAAATEPEEQKVVLPPPSDAPAASTTTTAPPPPAPVDAGSSSSSSSSSSSGTGSAPACKADFLTFITKLNEIQAGAPCDSTCDPLTHCCFDLASVAGGSSGSPVDGGTVSATGSVCITK